MDRFNQFFIVQIDAPGQTLTPSGTVLRMATWRLGITSKGEYMHDNTTPCPCGSNSAYGDCCRPVLADHTQAKTAEQLMRSRYTAFVVRHDQHILASWHSKTRPPSLNHEANPVSWIGLKIHTTTNGLPGDTEGSVEFTSSYVEKGQLCRLREKSTFLREGDLWYYVKGDCDVTQSKITRNQLCPCDSGKKFKRCCLNL